mgnify:CR=1 FL=1
MPLIPCVVCNNPVSKNAKRCPFCDEPNPTRRGARTQKLKIIIGVAILLFVGIYTWLVAVPELQQYGLFNNISQRK